MLEREWTFEIASLTFVSAVKDIVFGVQRPFGKKPYAL